MLHSSERPSKRRRTGNDDDTNSSPVDGGQAEAQYSDQGSEPDEYDLPPYDGETGGESRLQSANPPTYRKPYEDTFVTQLTQPPSSPLRSRGPRWRKRILSPSPPPPERINVPTHPSLPGQAVKPPEIANTSNGLIEDELALAAVLSSDDFEDDFEELSHRPASTSNAANVSKTKGTLPHNTASMRQTTLFGHSESQAPASTSHARTHNWPLAGKIEPPTHHKLDLEASKTWVYPTNLGHVRDYQFNIVQRGLFHNLLVALPTGLGKTFIAATIMLNWFRWTIDSQIVFVAPTKPLVSQQVEACFGIVGIPRSQTTMLTGNVQPAIRAEEWQSKRVFFMTPQTLVHDLKTGICDPKKLVLLVVDEAHRATGNYAYVEVVKFLRRFNSSFRVLALTATPGASVEAVQSVIDGLDIARVEIRTEESLDIRQFVHKRNIDIEVFENSEELSMSLELFSKALQPVLNQLVSLNAYWGRDPSSLTAYGLTKARQQWMLSDAAKKGGFPLKGKANALFKVLASLAHAIQLLKYHGIGSFYRNLLNFKNGISEGTNNGKYAKQIASDEHFKKLMNRLQGWVGNTDFIGHPKLAYLKTVVLNHFMDAGEGHGMAGGRPPSDTRIMIFVHYRDSAEEVTRVLKRHEPMIRPHVFVGQTGAKASEGMDQKAQLDVIEKFKKGTYNTIVATSIGEEGLDIGEVDLIVCYDSSSSPIRMLQRMGRTGRKRAGNIVLLLMKGKEEDSYMKAKDNYEKMQQMIACGSRFTFHDDRSPRIIPKKINPVADKRPVDIPVENSQTEPLEPRKRRTTGKKPPKKFHMPDGVQTGFVQASLINGRPKITKQKNNLDVEVAPLPMLETVLLSNKEEVELDQRYCNIGGSTPQYVQRPRFDAFPESQRKTRPVSKVGHSRVTKKLVKCLNTMQLPFNHTLPSDDLPDFERALSLTPRTQGVVRTRVRSTAESTGSPSSTSTAGADEAIKQNRKSSAAKRSEARRHLSPSDDDMSMTSPAKSQRSQLRQEQPFYVSQKSNGAETGSDEDLPDVDNLVSEKPARLAETHSDVSSSRKAPVPQRRRRQVVHDESDDE